MYETMLNTAEANDADLVWCDFTARYPDGRSRKISEACTNAPGALINAILSGKVHGYTWNKLFKRAITVENNIFFEPGLNMCEDLLFCIKYLLCCCNIAHVRDGLYNYRYTAGSLTQKFNPAHLDSKIKTTKIIETLLPDAQYHYALCKKKGIVLLEMIDHHAIASNEISSFCGNDLSPILATVSNRALGRLRIELYMTQHMWTYNIITKISAAVKKYFQR